MHIGELSDKVPTLKIEPPFKLNDHLDAGFRQLVGRRNRRPPMDPFSKRLGSSAAAIVTATTCTYYVARAFIPPS